MEALVEKFSVLGLSEYEARTYAALLRAPEATGPWISHNSGVPLSKVYEVLNRLYKKGFVLFNPDSRPRMYKAFDPQLVLETFVETQKSLMDEAKAHLVSKLARQQSAEQDKNIWIVQGQDSVDALVNSLLCKAKTGVLFQYATERHRGIREELKRTAERGVSVDAKPSETALNVINIDDRELLVFATKKEALWIRNPAYCKASPRHM
ncbi:MAG: TrmB family transcriptional regulator [Candidatus Aenigmarchaeota archaeon]|nr:TrmB family transcriptional regulator [Candidatus Aenigmarchaeota archaeon]